MLDVCTAAKKLSRMRQVKRAKPKDLYEQRRTHTDS